MSDFQHVRSGEPLVIPAGTYNAMLDAAQAHRNRRMTLAPHGSGFDSLFIHVVNETGKALQRFDVLGLDSPLETQDENVFCHQIVFKGTVPQKKHKGKFAIIQQDAAPNQIVRACIYGATIARIQKSPASQSNSQTNGNAEIKFCDIKEDETSTLTSGGNGAEVLWYDKTQWAIIRIGSGRSTLFPVKLEKTGGEAGDDEKATSWTYKVTDALTDEELETDIDPTASPHQWKRPSIGAYTAATFGYAHYDNDNKVVLGWLNEIPELAACKDNV
jgi:hypothetical protein